MTSQFRYSSLWQNLLGKEYGHRVGLGRGRRFARFALPLPLLSALPILYIRKIFLMRLLYCI